ncbi:MAG: tRNA threonylcarbamoyladenosine dehydratase [Clostridia bacterium]|nr:tRNA threonylcarbamoyladenosine dehydratase [Clostridia bacterium]
MSLLERSLPLFGEEGAKKLNNASVIVFGIGGVGSWCAEALARSGVGNIALVDGDTVGETNRNRQLIALGSTLGNSKAEICARRILDINQDCNVSFVNRYYTAETAADFALGNYGYIADCIDTVTNKLLLVQNAKNAGVPIISSMGTGNKLNPQHVTVKDIFATSGDGLARVMRKELRARGIEQLKVVLSEEKGGKCCEGRSEETRRATPSSAIFVPATAGLRMAYEIVNHIIED